MVSTRRNETEVSFQKLEKIAKILGIKVEDIVNFNESLVFNVMHNQTGITNGYVVNHNTVSENEKKLYEQIIAQQKEEIESLRGIIKKMQDKNT